LHPPSNKHCTVAWGHHSRHWNGDAGVRTSPLACWSASYLASRLAAWRPAPGCDTSEIALCGCAWRQWSSRRCSSRRARWPLTQGDPSLHSRLVCVCAGLQRQSATTRHAAQRTQQAPDSRRGCACNHTPLPCWGNCLMQHRHCNPRRSRAFFTSCLPAGTAHLLPGRPCLACWCSGRCRELKQLPVQLTQLGCKRSTDCKPWGLLEAARSLFTTTEGVAAGALAASVLRLAHA